MTKELAPALHVALYFDPGIDIQEPEMQDHTLRSLQIHGNGGPTWSRSTRSSSARS